MTTPSACVDMSSVMSDLRLTGIPPTAPLGGQDGFWRQQSNAMALVKACTSQRNLLNRGSGFFTDCLDARNQVSYTGDRAYYRFVPDVPAGDMAPRVNTS